jgi:hypothetical protein
MAIELHVKRIHTDSYDYYKIRIRRCPIRVGILNIYIARKLTAPLRRAVHPGNVLGQCFKDYACEEAVSYVRNSCELVPEIIFISKRLNNCPLLKGCIVLNVLIRVFLMKLITIRIFA